MTEERLSLPALEPPAATDRGARAEMARALAHPTLSKLAPLANGAVAVGLGAYTIAYLVVVFSIVF